MMTKYEQSNPLMPQECVEALRAVDLHVYFGIHGSREFLLGHGPAVLGVTDEEYKQAAEMVAELNAERGDVLAGEGHGFQDEWHPVGFLNGIRSIIEQSHWIDQHRFHELGDSLRETPPANAILLDQFLHINPDELATLAAEARRFRVLHPPEYAQALAVAKGVPCPPADASAEEMGEWEEYKAEERQRGGLIGRLAVSESLWDEAELLYRDKKMVIRLGHKAAEMDMRDRNDPPRLTFSAGEDHRRGVTRLLAANEVPFTQHALTPNYARRRAARTTRGWVSALTPFAKPVREKHRKLDC